MCSTMDQSLKTNLLSVDEDLLLEVDQTTEEETVAADQVVSEGWTSDSSVPPGWAYRRVPVTRKVLVQDPQGRKFDGRRNAILHLIKTNQDLETIGILDKGLEKEEDWSSSEYLPTGWKFKKTSRGKVQYLTSSYELIASHFRALDFVKNNLDNETVGRMQQWVEKHHRLSSSNTSFFTVGTPSPLSIAFSSRLRSS